MTDDPAVIAKRLSDEMARLRADCLTLAGTEVVAHCEGCGAWLMPDDDYVSNDDVSGCWAAMTDLPSRRARPCYAYRVGKDDARAHRPYPERPAMTDDHAVIAASLSGLETELLTGTASGWGSWMFGVGCDLVAKGLGVKSGGNIHFDTPLADAVRAHLLKGQP